MSMNSNDGIAQVISTGGELSVSWDFKISDRSELKIVRTRGGIDEELVLNSTYTIADNQLNQDLGGVAVLAGSATPAVAGDVYTLLLNTEYARGTSFGSSDFNQSGDLFADVLNKQLDNIVRMCQRLGRGVARSLRLPDTDTEVLEGSLPNSSERAGKALFFDLDGNPTVTNDVDTVSAAAAAASALSAANSAASAAASAAGFTVKPPCRMATTANITLSGVQTIDGVIGAIGNRVLVWAQSTQSQNGIYIMGSGAWTRATDSDTWDEIVSQLVTVQEGSTYADVNFLSTVNTGGILGTTAITYNPWQTIIPDNNVTNTKLADMAGNSIKVRASASTGDPSDLQLSPGQFVGRGSSGDISAMSFGAGLSVAGTTVNNLSPFTKEFTQTGITIVSSSNIGPYAHGLGVKPKLILMELICITAELGYSIGDSVYWSSFTDSANSQGTVVYADATNIRIRTTANSSAIDLLNGTFGTSGLSYANWSMTLRAWA